MFDASPPPPVVCNLLEINSFRYNVLEADGMNFLMRGTKKIPYREQIFDLLHTSHIERTGHGGRDIMRHDSKEYSFLGE